MMDATKMEVCLERSGGIMNHSIQIPRHRVVLFVCLAPSVASELGLRFHLANPGPSLGTDAPALLPAADGVSIPMTNVTNAGKRVTMLTTAGAGAEAANEGTECMSSFACPVQKWGKGALCNFASIW